MRRTTIILYGIIGGAVMLAAGMAINHFGAEMVVLLLVLVSIGGGRAVRARRRDAGGDRAARRHDRGLPRRPRRDHGPVLGVPRPGADHRSILGGFAAQQAGLDGIFVVSFVMLGIALLPLSQLRRYEHRLGEAPGSAARGPAPASAPG